MKNRLFIIMISLIILFTYQSKVFAFINTTHETEENMNIQIDKSVFMINNEIPKQYSERPDLTANYWVASLFLPGLGQILMGDFWRGVKFILFFTGMTILSALDTMVFGGILLSHSFILILIGLIIIFLPMSIAYVFNVKDAKSMADQILTNINNNPEKVKIEYNNFNTSSNKYFSFKVFAF